MAKNVLKGWLEKGFSVREEEEFPGFRPDLSVYSKSGRLLAFYEVTNTSDMTGEKIHRIQKWCYLNGKAVILREVFAEWILNQCAVPDEIMSIEYKII